MENLKYTPPGSRRILTRALLMVLALLLLIPVAVTFLYSFFSPAELKAFMQTRGSYDTATWMEVKLSPRVFSLNQYYEILIRDDLGTEVATVVTEGYKVEK